MFTVIQIIQLAALVILLVALLVLFCAVDLMVDLSKKGQDISGKIIIKWLFISYSRVFYPTESYPTESEGPDLKKEQDEDKKEEVENIGKKKKGLKAKDVLAMFNNIKNPLFRLFRDTMRNLMLRCGKCDLRFGLPDPADTGMLCGVLFGAFGSVHQYWHDFSYFLEPRFDEKVLDLQLMADVRLRIYKFIPIFLHFAFDRKVLRTSWLLVRTYRES
ncbi:MAG TPA: hypothetical protein DCG34_07150 [Clostridiales bacterium]|jgi:hypothetical protein|nr:hypothetical protein [Clostridiales bacterium]